MRRRILTAIVGVVLLSTIVLTLPLAVVLSHRKQADAVVELERAAERTAANIEPDIATSTAEIQLAKEESSVTVAVYDANGKRLAGEGPSRADAVTKTKGITTTDGTIGNERVLARPVIIDGERVATIRVAESLSEAAERTRADLLLLLAVDVAALVVAVTVGAILAGRLARPLREIRDDAVRLGGGDFTIGQRTSGVAEIDETSHAIADTAARLEAVLQRERTFSANASHQLRTPVTSMRLAVESELEMPRTDPHTVLNEVLGDLDRLETTIATLLAVARDIPREYAPVDLTTIEERLRGRWAQPLAARSRSLTITAANQPPARVSTQVLDEILDVLMDNALRHGTGPVHVVLGGPETGHLAISVADADEIDIDPDLIFQRRQRGVERHGLGLALARSLAEAEGGRLLLASAAPATFRLLLPDRA